MKSKKILLSFIGSNDAGRLIGKNDGAVITAMNNEPFDSAILLWNENKEGNPKFSAIVEYVKSEIISRKLAKKVEVQELKLTDVTDHNLIYTGLKAFTDTLPKSEKLLYTAAISSGTPAMQVSWILLAESGDFSEQFPLRLIKVLDPKFGKTKNVEVKLETSLPKIVRLKEENENLKKDLIPTAILEIEKGKLLIGRDEIPLSPIEFAYYRYFSERNKSGEGLEKFSGLYIPVKFIEKIYQFHEESFPVLDINREELRRMIKNGNELSASTFRGNISKINRKMRESLDNETLIEIFRITSEGKRGAKFYGINAPPEKVLINE